VVAELPGRDQGRDDPPEVVLRGAFLEADAPVPVVVSLCILPLAVQEGLDVRA